MICIETPFSHQTNLSITIKNNQQHKTFELWKTCTSAYTDNINLLDKTYEVSRVLVGLRPGHPFGINFSVAYWFFEIIIEDFVLL